MMEYLCYFVVVPHITDAIQEWVERVAKVPVDGEIGEPDVCIIEVSVLVPWINRFSELTDYTGKFFLGDKWFLISSVVFKIL